ncbi:hypothetical protein TGAM01_v210274 [Trichoderma gamsii]|uniref:Aflatoxin regulatory protein domain-containing protein n=1 Tax=Trichoderma gamsii TaxID=398673 RepID=A0A2P4Z9B9_9HYPO|nr:hypothetical protein TGAM01_v210274 [Trichoderma gamsii]PON20875.1 hypothetical protein TGAM01_v210274 [Trichoderma gamsii]
MLSVECITGSQRKIGRPRRPKPSGIAQGDDSLHEGGPQLDWSRAMSPAQVTARAMDDAFTQALTWPTTGMDSLDPYSTSWDTNFNFDQTNSLFSYDPGIAIPTPRSLQTPAGTASAANSPPFAPIETIAIPGPETADVLDASDDLRRLSKMNIDLHICVTTIKMHITTLDFNSVTYQKSPLCIDNLTLAEFMLKTSQDFLLILTRLLGSRSSLGLLCASDTADTPFSKLLQNNHLNLSSNSILSSPVATSEPLSAPLALTITSIFTQMLSIYELILEYITTRVERIDIDPIAPIPGLMFGGTPVEKPCIQGMLFCEVIEYLLQKTEQVLGIASVSEGGDVGLLSTRQISVLWSELNGRHPIIPGHAIMTPANMRRLFGKVAFIFKQLS